MVASVKPPIFSMPAFPFPPRPAFPAGPFPPFKPHRKVTGCSMCDSKHAACYVCLVEVAFIAAVLALFIEYYFGLGVHTTILTVVFGFGLLSAVVGVCLILSLLVGVCTNSAILLIPHMIGQIFGIIIMTVFAAIAFLVHFSGVKYEQVLGEQFTAVFLATAVLCVAMAIAEVWFFFLVRDCYAYLRQREAFQQRMQNAVLGVESQHEDKESPKENAEDVKKVEVEEKETAPTPKLGSRQLHKSWQQHFQEKRRQKEVIAATLQRSPYSKFHSVEPCDAALSEFKPSVNQPKVIKALPVSEDVTNLKQRSQERRVVIEEVESDEEDKLKKKP